MLLNCNYKTPQEKPNKKQLTPSRKEQIGKRVEQFASKLVMAGTKATDLELRVDVAKKKFAHNIIDLHDMTGKKANAWTRFLSVSLGENIGDAGRFRRSLYENKRYAEGLLHIIENQGMVDAVKPFTKRFSELAKQRGVKSADTGRLMTDLFEVGRTPLELQLHGKSGAVQELLQARNERWVEAMHRAGFTDADIDELALMAHQAGEVFDNLYSTIHALGKELPVIENIEYLPRIFSREAEDYFSSFKKPSAILPAAGREPRPDFTKARSSVWYTAEDHEALADLLGVKTHSQANAEIELAVAEGKTPPTYDDVFLEDIISDTAAFKTYIDEALTDELKDTLVDAGIISRVPMTSSELYEWYSTRHDLPFKSFDELLVTDPRKILAGYAQELDSQAANWGMLKSVREQGVGKGFLVDEDTAISEGLENFTKVSEMKSAALMSEAGIDSNVFMHKDAARILDAALTLERDPSALNALAHGWMSVMSLVKTQLLTTPQYSARIFISDALMYAAHGGEMHEAVTSFHDLGKYLARGLKAFDDVKPFRVVDGKTLTHRQFMELFASRRMTNITPMFDGAKRPTSKMEALNPLLAGNKISLMSRMVLSKETMPEMIGQFFKESGYVLSDWIKAIYQPFAFTANFMETAFKLGLLKSVTKRGDSWDGLRQGLRYVSTMEGAIYDSADEALEHVDRAFLTMDDAGELTGTVSRYVVPFFSYMWKSSSAILRDAVRHPTKYMQYGRTASMVFDRMEEQNQLQQTELFEPLNNDMPIPVYVDDRGRAVMLTLTNVHPILGFTQSTASNADKLARLLGVPLGTEKEVQEMLAEKYGIRSDGSPVSLADKMGEVMQSVYGAQYVNILAGVDTRGKPLDDEKYNTFLGIEVSQTTEALVGMVFPLVKTLNRYNPLGMFGSKEEISNQGRIGLDSEGNIKYDEGQLLREGKPSVFGTDRTDLDQKELVNKVTDNPAVFLAQLAGLSFVYNDTTRNLKYTHQDIAATQREIATAWKRFDIQIKEGKLPERQRILALKKQEDLLKLYGVFEYDRLRTEAYMAKKGITTKEFDVKVREKKLSLQGIPQLSLKETYKVRQAMEALKDVNK